MQIVLGISPGLSSLAYSVLRWNGARVGAHLDSDVLHAGKTRPANIIEIAHRCRAHQLVLDMVIDRHMPAVVALGPPVSEQEPPEHVGAVRLAIQGVGLALGVQVVDLGAWDMLCSALEIESRRDMLSAIRRGLGGELGSRDRRIVLATAAAVGAGWTTGC